jgi:hypothetical protein
MTQHPRSLRVPFLAIGFVAGALAAPHLGVASAQSPGKVFELRTYTAPEGKLSDLHKRFRDHTTRIFQKHGMTNVIYLKPQDPEKAKTTIVYLIAHASREAAKQSWSAFGKDPEWQKIAADSGVGRVQVVSEFFDPTDYSPLK